MTFSEKIALAKEVIVHRTKTSFVSGRVLADFIDTRYYFDEAKGNFYATVVFGIRAEGPPQHTHGGAIAALFDEILGATAWMNRLHSMTAQLHINYLKSIPLGQQVFIEANIQKVEGKKVTICARIFDKYETEFARAESLFIKQGKEKFQEMGEIPDELFTYGIDFESQD